MIVNVLGRAYTVDLRDYMDSDFYGECDFTKAAIRINKNQKDLESTIVHEVLHAIIFESGLKYIIDSTDGLEEALVRAIEHGLKSANMIPEVDFNELDTNNEMGTDNQKYETGG